MQAVVYGAGDEPCLDTLSVIDPVKNVPSALASNDHILSRGMVSPNLATFVLFLSDRVFLQNVFT